MLNLCDVGYRFASTQADKSIVAYQRYQSFCGKQELGNSPDSSEGEPHVVGVLPLLNRIVFVKKRENGFLYFILSLLRSCKILKSSESAIKHAYSHWRQFERDSQAPRTLQLVWGNLFHQEPPRDPVAVAAAVQGIADIRGRLTETLEALRDEREENRALSEDLEHNEHCLSNMQQRSAEDAEQIASLSRNGEALTARVELLQGQAEEKERECSELSKRCAVLEGQLAEHAEPDDCSERLNLLLQSLTAAAAVVEEDKQKIEALVKGADNQ